MAKITIEYEFSDAENGEVNASFKLLSDPVFPKKIEDWTEAQKSAVGFAEMASRALAEEAEQGCCEQGGCGCSHAEESDA